MDGFLGNGKSNCQDIDECDLDKRLAHNSSLLCTNGICINTIGFYRCECSKGFQLANDSNVCVDIDECEYESCFSKSFIDKSLCYSFGMCKNLIGTFECECFDGFDYDEEKGQCVG